jgi:hypothetical protein
MLAKPLPRFVIAKPLAGGAMGFYFTIPTRYRRLGCEISNEPLGTDYVAACGEHGTGGKAAALNALLDEWNILRKGGVIERGTFSRFGSVDWLFREYLRSEACRERVSDRSRPDYERIMHLVCSVVTKKGIEVGSLAVRSITPRAADKIYLRIIEGPRGHRLRQGEKVVTICKRAWGVVHRLYPDQFDKAVPNPWQGVTKKRRTKKIKAAVNRETVYTFATQAITVGHPEAAAAAVICFEWLQRPENVLAGCVTWPDYRGRAHPGAIRIFHHKTDAVVWHPLEEVTPDGAMQFYPEAEAILSRLPRRGVPMILKAKRDGTAEPFKPNHMAKLVRRLADSFGLATFTLDACRHGGMTELEEAALTTGQGRALSGHRTDRAYEGYAKRTQERALAATRKRRAHVLANEIGTNVQNDARPGVQNEADGTDAAIA